MKLPLGKILSALVLIADIALTVVLTSSQDKDEACGNFADPQIHFIQDYGLFSEDFAKQHTVGMTLGKMEEEVEKIGPVERCEAYMTPDGTAHIDIWQRLPKARFIAGDKVFYADRNGFVFDEIEDFPGDLPEVFGYPRTSEPNWLENVLRIASYMEESSHRGINFSRLETASDGSLTLIASSGERILLGKAEGIEGKLKKTDRYFRDIFSESNPYATVDLRFKGQIICRK